MNELKSLFNEVPIFKALALTSMMSMAKTNFKLTSYLKDDAEFKDFWIGLKNEFELSKKHLLSIADYEELMEQELFSKLSVSFREQLVRPLLVIQQYALQKAQENGPNQEAYEKLITRSLYGNINASRNSA